MLDSAGWTLALCLIDHTRRSQNVRGSSQIGTVFIGVLFSGSMSGLAIVHQRGHRLTTDLKGQRLLTSPLMTKQVKMRNTD